MSTREVTGQECSGLLPNPACSGTNRRSSRRGGGTLNFPFAWLQNRNNRFLRPWVAGLCLAVVALPAWLALALAVLARSLRPTHRFTRC